MKDLGWTLAWLTVQVTVVLAPALGLHALASRRGPRSGAWVATLSLAMVVVLGVLALLPIPSGGVEGPVPVAVRGSAGSIEETPRVAPAGGSGAADRTRAEADWSRVSVGIRVAWARFERRSIGPVARFLPWSRAFAIVAFAGSGLGLLRLAIGLWAVGLCRRRGARVDERDMIGLVDELRCSMGCGQAVEVREVSDLSTPATAGWLRPMLLLPGNWRDWAESERRAVVAHELAHIARGDYAAGLVARLALILNWYHPMVHWMAGRLHLEQELAADATGARFAGGRSSYLLALSRLALEQEGRPSSWPARAFLPARGTLIRRIVMLKNETDPKGPERTLSKPGRMATALGLLALTVGVATFKPPATMADDKPSPTPPVDSKSGGAEKAEAVEPFELNYLPEASHGMVAFRPARIARRVGLSVMNQLIRAGLGGDLPMLAKRLGVDMSRPGFVKFGVEDVESISCGFNIGRPRGEPKKNADGEDLHTLEFSGLTVRMAAPFDWPAFFQQWTVDLEEVREPRGSFYKVKDPAKAELFMGVVLYQPDSRTLVFESETRVKQLIAREVPSSPAYLNGADWHRASLGLLAVAINNRGDSFAKGYDVGRPDDRVVLSLFQGVDRWVLDVPDLNAIHFVGLANARDSKSAESVVQSIKALAKLGTAALDVMMTPQEDLPEKGVQAAAFRMGKSFLTKLEPMAEGSTVVIRDDDFGRFADLAAIIRMELEGIKPEAKEAKADAKAEKR